MNRDPYPPERLDVARLAADAVQIEGVWPLAGFRRLCADHPSDGPPPDGNVGWLARGESRLVAGSEPQTWLHLQLQARLWRSCQRCLQPVLLTLEVQRAFRFVQGEDAAAQLDAESELDVLALERWIDLHGLAEDEMLLALPLVPMHEACPVQLPMSVGDDEPEAAAPNPFASLADLRRTPH